MIDRTRDVLRKIACAALLFAAVVYAVGAAMVFMDIRKEKARKEAE